MQSIFLVGRLGRDSVIRTTADGTRFLSFTVAATKKIKGVEKTTWYDVTSRNNHHIDVLAQYLTKGSSVIVIGELDASIQDGTDGQKHLRMAVQAADIQFGPFGSSSGSTNASATTSATTTVVAQTPTETPISMGTTKPKAKAATVVTETTAAPSPTPAATSTSYEAPVDGNNDEELPF